VFVCFGGSGVCVVVGDVVLLGECLDVYGLWCLGVLV
jgi:hypothetical protein